MKDYKTSITVPNETGEKILKIGKLYPASCNALRAYVELFDFALQEIKGYFTKPELEFIISVMQGAILSPEMMANSSVVVALLASDSKKDEIEGTTWETLRAKIRRLTSAQVYFLQLKIAILKDNNGFFLTNFLKK